MTLSGEVGFLDMESGRRVRILLNYTPHDIMILCTLGKDKKPGDGGGGYPLHLEHEACRDLLSALETARDAPGKDGSWFEAGSVEFAPIVLALYNRDAPIIKDWPRPSGHILVHGSPGKLRLTLRFVSRYEKDDYIVTLDSEACGELVSAIESTLVGAEAAAASAKDRVEMEPEAGSSVEFIDTPLGKVGFDWSKLGVPDAPMCRRCRNDWRTCENWEIKREVDGDVEVFGPPADEGGYPILMYCNSYDPRK